MVSGTRKEWKNTGCFQAEEEIVRVKAQKGLYDESLPSYQKFCFPKQECPITCVYKIGQIAHRVKAKVCAHNAI